jgi:putative FmdB family regulatory protein
MPIYEYLCPDGHRFEVVQRFSDEPVTVCEVCGKPVQRVLFAPAVHYKGKGFYSTDYGRKGANGAKPDSSGGSESGSKESSSSSGSDSGSSSDSKSSESKSSDSKSSDSKSGSGGESSSSKKSDSSKPAA